MSTKTANKTIWTPRWFNAWTRFGRYPAPNRKICYALFIGPFTLIFRRACGNSNQHLLELQEKAIIYAAFRGGQHMPDGTIRAIFYDNTNSSVWVHLDGEWPKYVRD